MTQKDAQEKLEASLPPVLTGVPMGDMWPPPYFFEDGLRKVEPYFFTYSTYCKERWRGRTLWDVFSSEYRDRDPEYYRRAMEQGKISVNNKVVGPDYVLINNDLITNTIHRHESPVTGKPIQVIHEDNDLLVVNKPSGVPVHPAGRFRFNSITEILRSERFFEFKARPCHRLDRLTSGLLLFGKNVETAKRMSKVIQARQVRKEYVARVQGYFPDGEVVCDRPILNISPRLGLNRVRTTGKPALTVFKRLAYYPPPGKEGDEDKADTPKTEEELKDLERRPWIAKKGYSIVRCLPLTGRTHQLRVHLQFLGHPIQNDPLYANQRVWGDHLGCNDMEGEEMSDGDIMARLERMGKEEVADAVSYHDEMVSEYQKKRAEKLSGEKCEVCDTELYTDPGEHELALWLHSLRYEALDGKWSYTSPLPEWAMPPSGFDGPTDVGELKELIQAVDESDLKKADEED